MVKFSPPAPGLDRSSLRSQHDEAGRGPAPETQPDMFQEQATPKRVTFPIPPDARVVYCKGCAAPVYWVRTAAGKYLMVEGDGVAHFSNCPKADHFRRS